MADVVNFDQGVMTGGGEIMEVMMTGGDGGEMNEDTLAQVVSMLQSNGQLTGANQTIIIRQSGSDEIQMIQPSSNGQEFAVSKVSEADLQALQAANGVLETVDQTMVEGEQGQVVMVDEGGNLVEGVVQMQDGNITTSDGSVLQLPTDETGVLQDNKVVNEAQAADILANFNDIQALDPHNIINSVLKSTAPETNRIVSPSKPITISSSMNPLSSKPKRMSVMSNGEIVSIKINTGIKPKPVYCTPNAIKISTITGQQKYQPPKFHKCDACSINFVSKIAFMNHMENCPSTKRKMVTPLSGKSNITYTCVFCDTKFNSRLVLMQHVRTCEKAKSSKNLTNSSKLKVTTSESRLGDFSGKKMLSGKGIRKPMGASSKLKTDSKLKSSIIKRKESYLDPDDPGYAKYEEDSCSDEEKNIPYDDDEDFNDEDLRGDEEPLGELMDKSQKHLGPIITKGMFQCRDCGRTFSKETQYNRHVKGCSNTPLNTTKIIGGAVGSQLMGGSVVSVNPMDAMNNDFGLKRKRDNDLDSSNKKRALMSGKMKTKKLSMDFSDNESDDDIMEYLSGSADSDARGKGVSFRNSKADRNSSTIRSSINKIVKISPSDTLVKQTGKAILSKMNLKNQRRYNRDVPICGLCGDKFTTSMDLGNHTKVVHSEELLSVRDILDGKGNVGSNKCPLCDLYFVSPKSLLTHLVIIHNNELRTAQDELDSQNVNLSCPFCSEFFYSQELLKEHMALSHLDQLYYKPSSLIGSNPIDVMSLVKEKKNGSIITGNPLLSKQKSISCPDCGLVFSKIYFQHHKCASVNFSQSAKRFLCSEIQCSSLSFYKLTHLLTHLKQIHGKLAESKNQTFETLSLFMEWLKTEETQTKMKYTKSFQRMKQGKLMSAWICHRFHNAMKDQAANIYGVPDSAAKSDRLNQCYSRIYTESSFNASTTRYDGETSIQYFSVHQHPVEKVIEIPIPKAISPVKQAVMLIDPPRVPVSLPPSSAPESMASTTSSPCPPVETVEPVLPIPQEEAVVPTSSFSDAAELRQLLEGDDDFDPLKKPLNSSFDEQQLSSFDSLHPPEPPMDNKSIEMTDLVDSSCKPIPVSVMDNIVASDQVVTDENVLLTPKGPSNPVEEKEVQEPKSVDVASASGIFNDAELLLEKMLDEHDALSTEEPKDQEQTQPATSLDIQPKLDDILVDSLASSKESSSEDVPCEMTTKETEGELQKEDDVQLSNEEVATDAVEAIENKDAPVENVEESLYQENESQQQQQDDEIQKEGMKMLEDHDSMIDKDDAQDEEVEASKDSDGEEESTYVLPADIQEWNKLFELVNSQVATNSLTPKEMEEAKKLLPFENKINSVAIEKQVEIFNSLCLLANVQMT